VCPVCGYEIQGQNKTGSVTTGDIKDRQFVTVLKKVWPKRYTYRWLVGVYKVSK
jgi:hypothetical protein